MKILNANGTQHHNHHIHIYLDQHFSASLTPPNKQSFKVKSENKSRDHAHNL